MKQERIPYEKQIFVCTNDRKGESPSCGDHQGDGIFQELRRIAKERGYHPRIRVAQAKCLGKCNQGTNIMVYPDQVWFSEVTMNDVPLMAEQFLPQK